MGILQRVEKASDGTAGGARFASKIDELIGAALANYRPRIEGCR
jgi:hypothetical protein